LPLPACATARSSSLSVNSTSLVDSSASSSSTSIGAF
jgi:hypothetical protein